MADIFLSYASKDRDFAKDLSQSLEAIGCSVWWDREIPPGESFESVIETQLALAKCVVVLWSTHSVSSDYVKDEATDAKSRKILIPVLIEDVKIPIGFRQIQTARLSGWQKNSDHAGFQSLSKAVSAKVGNPRGTPVTSSFVPPPPGSKKTFINRCG